MKRDFLSKLPNPKDWQAIPSVALAAKLPLAHDQYTLMQSRINPRKLRVPVPLGHHNHSWREHAPIRPLWDSLADKLGSIASSSSLQSSRETSAVPRLFAKSTGEFLGAFKLLEEKSNVPKPASVNVFDSRYSDKHSD